MAYVYDALHEMSKGAEQRLDVVNVRTLYDAVSGAREFFSGPLLKSWATTLNAAEPASVTWDQIGGAMTYAGIIRAEALELIDEMEQLLVIARESYPMAEGVSADSEVFNNDGDVVDDDLYLRLRHEIGLAVTA